MRIELFKPLSIHEVGQRPNQEDSLWPREGADIDGQLFIVCDGMGGHEKGEVASQTFSKGLGEWMTQNATSPFSDNQLLQAIEYAYERLDEQDGGEFKKMGTTHTFLYIDTNGVTVAYIGDSRIYHIRPNDRIMYQSRDNSLVYDKYWAGEITYEEMATHPQKNVITKAVTTGKENRVDISPNICHITDVKPGDWFYLCSDGMLEQMSNAELLAFFSEPSSDEKKRDNLIEATQGNHDNHTAWLLHVKDVALEPGDELLPENETTSPRNAVNEHLRKQPAAKDETFIAPSAPAQNDFSFSYGTANDVVVVEDQGHRNFPGFQNSQSVTSPKGKKLPSANVWKICCITLMVMVILGGSIFSFFKNKPETVISPPKKTTKGIATKYEFKEGYKNGRPVIYRIKRTKYRKIVYVCKDGEEFNDKATAEKHAKELQKKRTGTNPSLPNNTVKEQEPDDKQVDGGEGATNVQSGGSQLKITNRR